MGFWDEQITNYKTAPKSGGFLASQQPKPVAPLLQKPVVQPVIPQTVSPTSRVGALQKQNQKYHDEANASNNFWGVAKNAVTSLPSSTVSVGKSIGQGVTSIGQSSLRGYASIAPALHEIGSMPLNVIDPKGQEKREQVRKDYLTLTPTGQFQQDLYGTPSFEKRLEDAQNKTQSSIVPGTPDYQKIQRGEAITARSVGEEIPMLKGAPLAPVVGFAAAASDLIPGGNLTKTGAIKLLSTVDNLPGASKILSQVPGMAPEVISRYAPQAVKVTDPAQMASLLDKAIKESQDVGNTFKRTTQGVANIGNSIGLELANKGGRVTRNLNEGKLSDSSAKRVFQESKDIITPTVGKYKFESPEVARQFIRSESDKPRMSKVLNAPFTVNKLTESHLFGEGRSLADQERRARLFGPGLEIIEETGVVASVDRTTDASKGITYYDIVGTDNGNIIRAKVSEKSENGKVYFTVSEISGGAPSSATASSARSLGRLTTSEVSPIVTDLVSKVNPVDRLIADGKIRVVSRDGRDIYQIKKGSNWVNTRDESSAVTQVTREPVLKVKKPESPKVEALKQKVEEDKIMIDIANEVISSHPGASLGKFRQRGNSEFAGMLPEVRKAHNVGRVKANGQAYADTRTKWQKKGDTIYQEAMNEYEGRAGSRTENMESAQDLLDDYLKQKQSLDELKSQIKLHRAELAEARKNPPLKISREGIPLAYNAREKGILTKARLENTAGKQLPQEGIGSIPASPAQLSKSQTAFESKLPPPKPITEGEATSLEILAKKSQEGAKIPPGVKGTSLPEIIEQTPVKSKVNILDYIRTPDRVLKKIGLAPEAEHLRKQYDSYLQELPKNLDKVTEWSKRVPKGADKRIFQYLDGQAITLSPVEREVALEVKAWLSNWADRLNLPKDNRIANYITHLFDDQLIKKEFDEDLAKILSGKIAGEVYNPFLQKRLGTMGYKQSVWEALDAYTKRATRKVYMDPALERIQEVAGTLEESQWNYVKNYVDRVNMRPTSIDNLIDNGIKSVAGYRFGQRPTLTSTRFLRKMAYRAMLGLNVGSALRNLSQGANTYAKLGEKYTAIGYMKLLSPSARRELVESGVLENGFIQDRSLNATKKLMEKADKGLFIFFDAAEKMNRGAAYLGAKSRGLAKGMSEEKAVEYARKIVRDTQFSFGSIDTPLVLSSDIAKTLGQFQSFTTKQTEFLTEMLLNKEFAGLARYSLGGLAFAYTIGQAFGMEPKELLPMYRFDTPASLKLPVEIGKAGLNIPDKYGNPRDIEDKAKDIGDTFFKSVVPAGTQIRKSIQGFDAVNKGASTNGAGSVQYKVGGSPLKDAQAVVFGKSSTKEAKDYFAKRDTPEEKVMQTTYDNVQKLDAEGKGEEAQAIVEALSDEDYELYKKIRTSDKRKKTLEGEERLFPTVKEVQELVKQGQEEEAQAIVDALSDEDYRLYTLAKKKLQ